MNPLTGVLLLCSVAFATAGHVERLKGGETVKPGEFPYQASVQINKQHVCGGALITSRHVVTSASCLVHILRNPNLFQRTLVLLGTMSLARDGLYYKVSRVTVHPEFQYSKEWSSYINDIGVITLEGNVQKSQWIDQVNLPAVTELSPNTPLVFTGWGSVSNAYGPTVEYLQKGILKSISTNECQKFYPQLQLRQYQLCTSPNFYVGTCTTDSGSPLVYNNQLIGVSTGVHGCATGVPDVFTKVSYYLKFIIDEVNRK